MPDGIPFDETDGLWRYGTWEDTDTRTGPRRNAAERQEQRDAIRALAANYERVVYAAQFPNGVIKIGCTSDLAVRICHYAYECEILAFIPGDFSDEAAIHKSLRPHLHHGREWYNPTPEVLAVVNDMRDHFRLPPIAA